MSEIQVLHVDDEPDFVDLTKTFLEREDDRFAVETATDASEGLQVISDCPPDCVISDYNMPGMDGLEFLQAVREEYPDLPFILFTGKGGEAVASDAISAGVTDYLQKGSDTSQYAVLANRISNAVEAARSVTEAEQRRHRLQQILKTVPGCVVQLNTDGEFIFANERAEAVLGLETDELTNRTYNDPEWELQKPSGAQIPDEELPFRQVCDTGEPVYNAKHTVTWPDGSQKVLSVNAAPLFDETGAVESVVASLSDITDRRERQRELQLLQQAIDDAEVPITLADPSQPDEPLVYVNDAFEEITGYPPEETLGHNCRFLQGEGTDPEKVSALRDAIDNEESITVELRNYRKDGTEFWNSLTVTPIYSDDGELVRYLGTQKDVTERREREARLAELNQATQALMMAETQQEVADIGVKAASDILDLNANGIHFAESDDTELVPVAQTEKVTELADDTTVLPVADSIAGRVYRNGEPEAIEDVRQDPDAHDPSTDVRSYLYIPLSDHGILIAGDEQQEAFDQQDLTLGEVLAENLVAALDRVGRKQELREIKNQYQTLVENFPDGAVFLYDSDLQYVRAQGEELDKVGLFPADFIGKDPHALFPEDIADELCHYYEEALDGIANTFEQEYRGERYRTQTVPVRNGGEEINHAMAVTKNITEEAEDKRRLKRQNERLEEFTGIVSHDLRNPLGVAEGHLELAQTSDEGEHITKASNAIKRCQTLIEDLLALSRDGDQVDETDTVVIGDVAEGCWKTAETAAASLTVEAPQTIKADRSRLQQLLENLYRNAVEHGGDDVTVSVSAIAGGFTVADDGPGIPKSDREEIFKAGYSTSENGTGFGLRIVKQVANAHGWDVRVTESERGGAQFEFTGVQFVE